ncbi:hypothetical protein BZG36_03347 [Bifiguratus adelaidae]|uniref:Heat shock factor-binding protein 1 n=1 Tax=Bifiguratus adelaidae TaxID=1938954 RepID=A0A261XWY3_9FUNG|nr:hypothetical protein BZG36_03347 [Bifiguratus adelaidae]
MTDAEDRQTESGAAEVVKEDDKSINGNINGTIPAEETSTAEEQFDKEKFDALVKQVRDKLDNMTKEMTRKFDEMDHKLDQLEQSMENMAQKPEEQSTEA